MTCAFCLQRITSEQFALDTAYKPEAHQHIAYCNCGATYSISLDNTVIVLRKGKLSSKAKRLLNSRFSISEFTIRSDNYLFSVPK